MNFQKSHYITSLSIESLLKFTFPSDRTSSFIFADSFDLDFLLLALVCYLRIKFLLLFSESFPLLSMPVLYKCKYNPSIDGKVDILRLNLYNMHRRY